MQAAAPMENPIAMPTLDWAPSPPDVDAFVDEVVFGGAAVGVIFARPFAALEDGVADALTVDELAVLAAAEEVVADSGRPHVLGARFGS